MAIRDMKRGNVNLYVIKEDDFRIWGGSFAITPSPSGYTLAFSTDGVNYKNKLTVAAYEPCVVTDCVPGTYYKLIGNSGILGVYYNTSVTDEDIQRIALGGGVSSGTGNGSTSGGTGGGGSSAPMVSTTHAELKALRDAGNLVAGMQYRITDYECMVDPDLVDVRSAGHRFDIIVTADSPTTLNENARACHHDGDVYFAVRNLEAWELKYDIDGGGERFAWVKYGSDTLVLRPEGQDWSIVFLRELPEPIIIEGIAFNYEWGYPYDKTLKYYTQTKEIGRGGLMYEIYEDDEPSAYEWFDVLLMSAAKGVIYGMRDEWGNECPYDFKNIQYRQTDGAYAYTFTLLDDGEYKDMSTAQVTQNLCPLVFNVVMRPFIEYSQQHLNRNVIISESSAFSIHDISFDAGCSENTLATNCNYISFGKDCRGNEISRNCFYIDFEAGCRSNQIDADCQYIHFGVGSCRNKLREGCYHVDFAPSCLSNTIESGCQGISFMSYCCGNSIAMNCESISFGAGCSYNEIAKAYTQCVNFHAGASYIVITSTSTTGKSNRVGFVEVLAGTRGLSSKKASVNVVTNYAGHAIVAYNSTGVVSVTYYSNPS